MNRKKKLKILQFSLLVLGSFIIFFTYYGDKYSGDNNIISEKTRQEIKNDLSESSSEVDIFSNIKYSGLDLAGNRYIIKSKSAFINKNKQEIVSMTDVEALFYFKDDTILKVSSDNGTYNNKTLDMDFIGNVNALYEESQLFASKASYSNSQSFLSITENVKIKDIRGTMFADKLLFDIKKKKLKITSFESNKINTKVNIEWKKDFEY